MRYLSIFSGIEAATVALRPLEWEPVAFSEIEPAPCRLLAEKYPEVPNLGDVRAIEAETLARLGQIDIVIGGSPCQDLSNAGRGAGIHGERSRLFFEQMRIFDAARSFCGARWCLWENVPGAFSRNAGRDFAAVVGADFGVPPDGWSNTGVCAGPRGMVEWCTLGAQWFGVPQRRRRIFALIDSGNWTNRPPILFDAEALRRDSSPREAAGQDITGTLVSRANGRGPGPDDAAAGFLIPVLSGGQANAEIGLDVCPTLTANRDGAPIVFDPTKPAPALAAQAHPPGVTFAQRVADPLTAAGGRRVDHCGNHYRVSNIVAHRHGVRRLTPRECERLQGFPDDYTAGLSNTQRYRALGNSMAVPVVRWIGERVAAAISEGECPAI